MLNIGTSPITEGTYRAFLTALATFLSVTLVSYQVNITGAVIEGDRWKEAAIAGLIAALAPFVSQTVMAASDQSRANRDVISPADVPVAAETLRVERVAPP
jgi:hypothetical protein